MVQSTASSPRLQDADDGDHSRAQSEIRSFPFFLPYIVPVMTIVGQCSSVQWHALMPPLFVWVFIPLLDFVLGSGKSTTQRPLTRAERRELESRVSFKLAICLWCPVQFGMLIWAANLINRVEIYASNLKLLGLLWSIGLIATEGINCSHELFHRRSRFERFLGKLLLVSVFYGHFSIEHARGHHFNVGTWEDPATMRFGESFYSFFPRTVVGGYRSAWRLEKNRLAAQGLPLLSFRNEMILFALGQGSLLAAFYYVFGLRGLMLYCFQAACAIFLLEQINGIEHYGLTRKRLPSGGHERVGPRHSWDATQTASSFLLFKLQIHADHHLHASKRYQTLELTKGSPQLPAGYLSLAPLLLVPPLWRAVMDPVLRSYWEQWDREDLVKAKGQAESSAGQ